MSILLKQEIKYYIINTDVTNNLSLKKRIPCIQYVNDACDDSLNWFIHIFMEIVGNLMRALI